MCKLDRKLHMLTAYAQTLRKHIKILNKTQQLKKQIKKESNKNKWSKCHHHQDETVLCKYVPTVCMPWHHEARGDSVRNMLFIICKQLSIHQRQRHSVALVTAYGRTPSYDMIQQDLIGQMCVIINGVPEHQGVYDEFPPLMKVINYNDKIKWEWEEHGGEQQKVGVNNMSCQKAKRKWKK